MPHYNNINPHRFQISRRVEERLALANRTGLLRELYDVGAQSICSQGKADSSSRAVLEEQIHNDLSSQRRSLFDRAGAYLLETDRRVENITDLLCAKFAQSEQMLAIPLQLLTLPFH